jgi:DNA-binding response OmpR family regulator
MSQNSESELTQIVFRNDFPADGLTMTGTILIAEDDAATRTTFARHLEREGYTVVGAADGLRALEMIREAPPDLILLDIYMPGMDGRRVLESIRADERLRHLPVIMITTDHALDTVVECISLGADDYLVKPPNSVLLRARIKALLERKFLWDYEMALHAELQRGYEQLSRLTQFKDNLTHMVVHDLRISLSSLLSGLMTLKHFGGLSDVQQEIVEIGLLDGRSLLGTISDLQDIKSMGDGSLKLRREPQAAHALVNSVIQQVTVPAQGKDLRLAADVDPDLPNFSADGEKVKRTLVNLLGVACHFASDGGVVTISVRHDMREDAILFAVSNSGDGIPREIFEQLETGDGPVDAGMTALAFTFCKKAVELHGGHLWFDAESGKDSAIAFLLPLTPPTPSSR